MLKQEEQEKAGNGSVVVKSATDFDSSMWSSPTTGKRENGDDGDPWGNGGWEFNVAETKKDLTNKVQASFSYNTILALG